MSLPAIWQTPFANAIIKNGARSFIDGDAVAIPFTFLRPVTKVRYITGKSPYGVDARADGLYGTMAQAKPGVTTQPRDYVLTVRAHTAATQDELDSGLPAEWYEERTFTIKGGLWYDLPAGALTNTGGVPFQRGDNVNLQFAFDPGRTPLKKLELIGGVMPPGLTFSPLTYKVSGTLAALPKDQLSYPMLFRAWTAGSPDQFQDRAYDFQVNPIDEKQGWDVNWLDALPQHTYPNYNFTVYDLGTVYRGTTVEIQLQLDNPDNDPLDYKVTGFPVIVDNTATFEGLPEGLTVSNDGKLVGTPVVGDDTPGIYFFKVYARDPAGTEGQPRTSELVYQVTLDDTIKLDQYLNDSVKWLTNAGSLGSTYETFYSHFGVSAVPQFNLTALSNEYQTVNYQLLGSSPFPTGVVLQNDTGLIVGQMPHVDADTTYTFKVRARVVFINKLTGNVRQSSTYSDRQFSFSVKNLYLSDNVSNIYISVPPFDRAEIADWVYGIKGEFKDSDPRAPSILTIVGRDVLYRLSDPAWGRVEYPRILLAAGVLSVSPNNFQIALADYHHKNTLRFGELKWAKGVDPSGNYVYDVIYFTVTDPLAGAGGFNNLGGDAILPSPTKRPVRQYNLPANSDRYHPTSLVNARKDLINVTNREPWLANPIMPETQASRGLGIPGKEGLPFWMTCEQVVGKPASILGWTPAIELAYLQPGKGAQAVKSLIQVGFQKALQGRPIVVDRYLVITDGLLTTSFDLDLAGQTITSWDGPDATPPTVTFMTFDQVFKPTSKYYKFPPGDA